MRNSIRQLAQLTFLTIIVAMTAMVAAAQTDTGTVTINGSVGKAASLRWYSFTNLNSTSGTNAPNTQNSPLSFTLNVGDVSPNNTNSYVGGTVTVILRTNSNYTLSAQVTASSGFGAAGNTNGDIALTDIGFGLTNLASSGSGSLVTSTAVSGSSFAGSFGNNPSAAAKNADGIPSFTTTLNNISAATQVLSGPRISKGGGLTSPNNGLLVDTNYTIGPQFFNATGNFSATITYTLATP